MAKRKPAGRAAGAGAVGAVIVSRRRIARRLDALSAEIAAACPDGELTMLVVLTGAMVFAAELLRRLPLRVCLAAACVRSYPGGATESCGPRWRMPLVGHFKARDVLIVDDILDTGATLEAVKAAVGKCGPARVRTCVLFRKDRPDLPRRREADFVGMKVPNVFVVGCGLDHDEEFRNLRDLHELKTEKQPRTRLRRRLRRGKPRTTTRTRTRTEKTGNGRSRSRITITRGNGERTKTKKRMKQTKSVPGPTVSGIRSTEAKP